MRHAFRSSIAALSLLVSQALAADLPSFEVASVRHSDPKATNSGSNVCAGGPGTSDPGILHCRNSSLALLILQAYDVKWYQLVSPDWVIHGGSETGYDVTAKIPPGTSKSDYRLMLQHLLADRFHLVVHRETRELPVYSLVSGKGPKVVPSPSPAPPGPRCAMSFVGNHFHWVCHNTLIKDLAGNLETQFWKTVNDETGLSGEYDFTLDFIPAEEWQSIAGWSPSSAMKDDTANLDAAISGQLGLRLVRGKGPSPVLVLDKAEKNPTEN